MKGYTPFFRRAPGTGLDLESSSSGIAPRRWAGYDVTGPGGGGGQPLHDSESLPSPVDPALEEAGRVEAQHEIFRLSPSGLDLNSENWDRFQEGIDPFSPTLVVSFLGDTSAGKSHTIRELMSPTESRPFCQDSTTQQTATTFNVNLFQCRSIVEGTVINLVDYEGENGSNTPLMATARALAWSAIQLTQRHRAVNAYLPKLAYTTSDLIVVVCREPFYNRRYLERCLEFAKRANANVNNVDSPALLLIGNKLPGEECELDIQRSTKQFYNAWREEAPILDAYFSAVVCVYVPHKRGFWYGPNDEIVNGKIVFQEQIQKIKTIIKALANKRAPSAAPGTMGAQGRLITRHHGLWFALLPTVLRELNAHRGVDVAVLIDEAWSKALGSSSSKLSELDIMRAFLPHLKHPMELSLAAPLVTEDVLLRFESTRNVFINVAARAAAAKLRLLGENMMVPTKLQAYIQQIMDEMLNFIDSMAPCKAIYPGSGVPTQRADAPVACLQEARFHHNHRTSRLVKGGSGFWRKVFGIFPRNEAWEGPHQAPAFPEFDLEAAVQSGVNSVLATKSGFLRKLFTLQEECSSPRLVIGFAPLEPLPSFLPLNRCICASLRNPLVYRYVWGNAALRDNALRFNAKFRVRSAVASMGEALQGVKVLPMWPKAGKGWSWRASTAASEFNDRKLDSAAESSNGSDRHDESDGSGSHSDSDSDSDWFSGVADGKDATDSPPLTTQSVGSGGEEEKTASSQASGPMLHLLNFCYHVKPSHELRYCIGCFCQARSEEDRRDERGESASWLVDRIKWALSVLRAKTEDKPPEEDELLWKDIELWPEGTASSVPSSAAAWPYSTHGAESYAALRKQAAAQRRQRRKRYRALLQWRQEQSKLAREALNNWRPPAPSLAGPSAERPVPVQERKDAEAQRLPLPPSPFLSGTVDQDDVDEIEPLTLGHSVISHAPPEAPSIAAASPSAEEEDEGAMDVPDEGSQSSTEASSDDPKPRSSAFKPKASHSIKPHYLWFGLCKQCIHALVHLDVTEP